MGKNQGIWRKGPEGLAHLVDNSRARCAKGGFPKGKRVNPPEKGDEIGYCYSCHYLSLFGSLPETKRKVLPRLMNRELEHLVLERTEVFKKGFDDRDKAQNERAVELTQWQEKLNKQSSEIQNLKDAQKDNEKLVEGGKAFEVLSEAIGDSIMKSSMRSYRGYYMGRD